MKTLAAPSLEATRGQDDRTATTATGQNMKTATGIALLALTLIQGCADPGERYDVGYDDGYAAGFKTTCEIRATMIEGDFENDNYSRGYSEGYAAGSKECLMKRDPKRE